MSVTGTLFNRSTVFDTVAQAVPEQEKIFVEEAERALASHPDVRDAVVVGRSSPTWGSEVVALVELDPASDATDADLLAECQRHIARYKMPKAILRLPEIVRSPSGKADYRWASHEALDSSSTHGHEGHSPNRT